MYEQHFGLKKRPFRANATGTDVFVGPHIAATMAGLKKALSGNDAVVTVSGPVGSGKTTLVNRALESVGTNHKVISVARMRLKSDDVLELLLDELGVEDKPAGAIQKFAQLRRSFKSLEDKNSRIYIVIEDTVRLGADTLAEVEALTAADAGQSEGASLILMGDDELKRMLQDKQLGRLQQRIGQRFDVQALPLAEMRGYLRHCFRLAGSEFERIFETNAANLLHYLGGGIPRVSNNLVDAAMRAAEDLELPNVPSSLLARVAENEYGLSAEGFDLTPIAERVATAEPDFEPMPVAEFEVEPLPVLPPIEVPGEPAIVFAAAEVEAAVESVIEEDAADDIPELIQDTLPDLEILAPNLATLAIEPEPEPEPEPVRVPMPILVPEIEPEIEPEPELVVAAEPEDESTAPGSSAVDVPAWDRDPTIAELRPDLDALEQAMALAQGDKPLPTPVGSGSDAPPVVIEEPEVIPEITLDHAISQRVESKLIDEPGEVSAPATESAPDGGDLPAINLPKRQTKKADAELESIAAELAKAKSLEDVDEKLAETLFGDELNFIAAQVLANPPQIESANDDLDAVAEEQVLSAQAGSGQAMPEQIVQGAIAAGRAVPTGADDSYEVTLEAPSQHNDGGLDLSASQRLKTVRALNADLHPSIREPEATAELQAGASPSEPPESIEDQINTSMTQTLKALNVTPPIIADDADDDDELKGGFFSRFKR